MITSENASRQIAIVSGCAPESRTSGPAKEIPTRARTRTSVAGTGGGSDEGSGIYSLTPSPTSRPRSRSEDLHQAFRVPARILPDIRDERREVVDQLLQ